MGLAASQTRLLSLTARQHTVEHNAQRIQNNKMRLSNDSDRVYQVYLNALNDTALKTLQTSSETGDTCWINGNINNLMRWGTSDSTTGNVFYVQDISTGKLYVPKAIGEKYDIATDARNFAEQFGITYTQVDNNQDIKNNYNNAIALGWDRIMEDGIYAQYLEASDREAFLTAHGLTSEDADNYATYLRYLSDYVAYPSDIVWKASDSVKATYYEEIYNAITSAGGYIEASEQRAQNDTWVQNMIKNAQVILTTWDDENSMLSKTSASLNTNIKEVTDNTKVEKASQEYEAEMALINNKDTSYDTILQTLESERTSLTTEIDSLQNVIDNNIDKHFKLYS